MARRRPQRVLLATFLMMMNAGSGFRHEESTPAGPVEMLQVFVRPRAPDLAPQVAFWDRPNGSARPGWQLVAGPEGSEAPLGFRQRVMVLVARAGAGEELAAPVVAGMVPLVNVTDGSIRVGGQRAQKRDALSDADAPLPPLRATRDTTSLHLWSIRLPLPHAPGQSADNRGLSWYVEAATDRVAGPGAARFGLIDRSIREVTSRLHASLYACHHRIVNGYRTQLLRCRRTDARKRKAR